MPPEVYKFMKERCQTVLRRYFLCTATPIEGPAKKDFGDIDILVCWPHPPLKSHLNSLPHSRSQIDHIPLIERALGAEKLIRQTKMGNFAVPWPDDLLPTPGEDEPRRFIQVDVRICSNLAELQWMLFKHAHGDIWNIIGATIRPYGLTADETALWLRVPEIETYNRKGSKILLTSDPSEVLSFLGMEVNGFWEEAFESLRDMYEYAASCRMFWVHQEDGTDGDGVIATLKANDRRRRNTRPGFRLWMDEFLPACREQGRFLREQITREQIRVEAVDRFAVRDEYATRLDDFIRDRRRETVWNTVIKGFISELPEMDPLYRGCLLKGLRKIVMEGDTSYGIEPTTPLKNADGIFVLENVWKFVSENHERVGQAGLDRHQQQYREKMMVLEASRSGSSGGQ
jgi:hypothetical protein